MNRNIAAKRAPFIALGALLLGGGQSALAQAMPITLTASDVLALVHARDLSAPVSTGTPRKPEGALPDGRPLAIFYRDPEPAPPAAYFAQAEPPAVSVTLVEPAQEPAREIEEIPASTSHKPEPVKMAQAGPSAPAAPTADQKTLATSQEMPEPEAPAQLQGEPESLRDAIVASLKSNPDIQIALAKQDDARFGVGEARAGYFPHLDVTVGYGPEISQQGHTPGNWNNRLEGTATLNQNIWDFGTTINDIKRARATYRSAQWATREQIESISFDITNAYLGMLQQQKLITLTNEEIAATRKILRMVTVQKDLGLTTQADVDRAKARVENIQSTLLDRQSALQQSRDAYRRLTDRVPGLAADLPGVGTVLPQTVGAAIEMIDDHSPRMAQAVEDRRSLAKQYASQTGTFFPRVGLQLQGNHKYDVLGSTGLTQDARAMVTLSYNFLNGGADVATRNRIGARLRQADYELERRRREVEQDLRADFESLTAARQKISTINAEISSAVNVAELYKQQFREGKRSVFDLLDSQQVLFGARTNEVVNEIAMHLAEYRVLQKLGGLFDLVSGSEPLPPLVVPVPPRK